MEKPLNGISREKTGAPGSVYLPQIIDDFERCIPGGCHEIETKKAKRKIIVAPHGSQDEDRLTITSPTGEVELSIRLTEAGPVLMFSKVDIALKAPKRLTVASQEIALVADRRITTKSLGDHIETVSGAKVTEAESVALKANLGGVQVSANDDVSIEGERIFLNK